MILVDNQVNRSMTFMIKCGYFVFCAGKEYVCIVRLHEAIDGEVKLAKVNSGFVLWLKLKMSGYSMYSTEDLSSDEFIFNICSHNNNYCKASVKTTWVLIHFYEVKMR